jgi:predicted lysophospholipase L1 biosynthesis ABC-type transport system permease subunit
VGNAGNARWVALQDPDAVEVYHLASAGDVPWLVAVVRTTGSPEAIAPLAASAARAIDVRIFPDVRLVKTSYAGKLRETEITALSLTVLGICALLLACLGIVGLVAYSVSQRTKEIGIRMALGAQGSHVLSVVLQQLSRPVVVGLLLGIAGAAAMSQVLRRELYGVSNLDPMAYAAAIGLFVLAATLTALVPARRALRVDPLKALRYE